MDIDKVRRLLEIKYPMWKDMKIKEVKKMGNDNYTYHIGDKMSIRIPSADRYRNQAMKEQKWLRVLEPHVSVEIPKLIDGSEGIEEFPYPWGIYSWIEGDVLGSGNLVDKMEVAEGLAKFLKELHSIDTNGGPLAGKQNFYRGGALDVYNEEVIDSMEKIGNIIDREKVMNIWKEGLESSWGRAGVWIHGDFVETNILVDNGRLKGIIDFGQLAVGDPACDLVLYWTYFDKVNRVRFRREVDLDSDTWARARGWILWKSLISIVKVEEGSKEWDKLKSLIDKILNIE